MVPYSTYSPAGLEIDAFLDSSFPQNHHQPEAKNKEKLLKKASEFALFDKSTSVVSCKRTNRIVR